MHLTLVCNVWKFNSPSSNTFRDMNYFLVWFLVQSRLQTEYRQTDGDAYEPTVQIAQVGPKNE